MNSAVQDEFYNLIDIYYLEYKSEDEESRYS